MPAHIIDSIFFQDLYGTARMRAVFDDMTLLQRWLDVEVALARAEADLGLIPTDAADEIMRKAHAENLDVTKIKQLIDQTIHPIVPVIRVLDEACDGDAGEYIHWGATTQDIMDTANVLQIKDAIVIIEERLETLTTILRRLAIQYRDTVMSGRTHGQHALPITFGFKVAVWLAEVQRHRERLQQCKPRVLVGQFAGAVGTLASVSERGLEIHERIMEILGLGVPSIAWHTSRDTFAEFTAILGMIAATTGKIANEVITLQKTEVAEIEEPFTDGKVGSSTMPHKRNPMLCEAIMALSRLVVGQVPSALHGMIQEHERDMGAWQMEWAYLPEACIMTDGALALTNRVLDGLLVYPEKMRRNLEMLDGMMLSEAVMFALGESIGRQTAHNVVYDCAMLATESGRPFRETLSEHPQVAENLSLSQIAQILDPDQYVGLARVFVDRVVTQLKPSPTAQGEGMDWESLIQQKTPHTAIQRGGLTAWPAGASQLIGDSLGPKLHFHDDASEIFYIISGRCRMEVGNTEEVLEPGDFALVPPLVPHNIWNGGDDNLVLLWLVAPNFVDNKWRTDNFAPGAMESRIVRGRVNSAVDLPSDSNIASATRSLDAGQRSQERTSETQEAILYVLDGNGTVSVDGIATSLRESTIIYIPAKSSYTVTADNGVRYLEFRTPAS